METRKRNILLTVATFVAAGLVAIYAFNGIYRASYNPFVTEVAYEASAYETADITVMAVRDESLVYGKNAAVTVSPVEDGERVRKGDTCAVACSSAADAAVYAEISELESKLERYSLLTGKVSLNILSIESLNKEIRLLFGDFLNAVASGGTADIKSGAQAFRDKELTRSIAVNGPPDLSGEIDALNAQLAALRTRAGSVTEITADRTGYFISGADGYENAIPFDSVSDLTAEQIQAAMDSPPAAVPDTVVGRLVGRFNWYLVTVLDYSQAVNLKEGSDARIEFTDSAVGFLDVKVNSVESKGRGKVAVTFSCRLMNEEVAALRLENAKLVLTEYTGYKLSGRAVREVDGVTGVYIRRGGLVSFRPINIIYSADTYVLAEINSDTSEHLMLYDTVIVEGTDLYDGKVIS